MAPPPRSDPDLGRPASRPNAARVCRALFDELDGIADGLNGLRRIVRNLDSELFFEGHDQLDRVEAVRAEVVNEARFRLHLVGVHAEMLDDDLLHPVSHITHCLLVLDCFWNSSGRTAGPPAAPHTPGVSLAQNRERSKGAMTRPDQHPLDPDLRPVSRFGSLRA